MFPERRLLHKELNAFNRLAVKEMCVIIVAKVVGIGQKIVTHFADFQESIPIAEDISFNHLNTVRYEMKLLTVAIIGFLNSSLIAALVKFCLTHQCVNRYSLSQVNSDRTSFSSSNRLKYLLLIGFPARRLSKCGVPQIRVRTGGCSR